MQSNADVPLWLQFDFSIDMLQPSEKVPDVILATEARTQELSPPLPVGRMEQLYALQKWF